MTNNLTYYKFNKILSYNATFNIVTGARGLGKTYGAKRIVIKNFIRSGEQFIYLRRFASDLKSINTFFSDISHEFPKWELRVKNGIAECKIKGAKEWNIMGYFLALSKAGSHKSVAYPLVSWIIYDEFILEIDGFRRYIANEEIALQELYSTVDRWQDRVRVLMLSNSVSITNPYFIAWNIRPDELPEISLHANGFIAAQFVESELFASEVYKTKFGQFIADTEYASYSVSNKFADANNRLISVRDVTHMPMFNLETRLGVFSVWYSNETKFFVSEKLLTDSRQMFTLEISRMDSSRVLLERSDPILVRIRSAFNVGNVLFDSVRSRNAFIDIFRR